MGQRRGGIIYLKADGELLEVKGNFSYALGKVTREALLGASEVQGYTEKPTVPFIEGELTDSKQLDADKLSSITDSTITLELANGKTIVLNNAWSCNPDGYKGETEEGNIGIRFEGLTAQEIK